MCIWTDPRAAFVENVDLDSIAQDDYDAACETLMEAPDPGSLPLPGPLGELAIDEQARALGIKSEELLKLCRATKAPVMLVPDASRI